MVQLLTTVIDFISKWATRILYAVVFIAGILATRAYYLNIIADLKAEQTAQVIRIQEESNKKLQEREATITQITDERIQAQTKIDALSSDLATANGRVLALVNQQTADSSSQSGTANNTSSKDASGVALRKCQANLKRSKKLIGRYSNLLAKSVAFGLKESADKDALAKIIVELNKQAEKNKTKDKEK